MDNSHSSNTSCDGFSLTRDTTFDAEQKTQLFQMCDTGHFSDVTVVVDGKHFHCHKNILAAGSEYFRAMFRSGMKENASGTVTVHDIDHQVFGQVVSYLYTGKLSIPNDKLQRLMVCADMFQLAQIKGECSESLQKTLTLENCFQLWKFAIQVYSPLLAEDAWEFCLENFSEVTQCNEFLKLDIEDLRLYLSDIKLNISKEEEASEAGVKWLERNSKSADCVSEVLSSLRLHCLEVNYIRHQLLRNKNVQKHPSIVSMLHKLLNQVLHDMGLPPGMPAPNPRLYSARKSCIIIFGNGRLHDHRHVCDKVVYLPENIPQLRIQLKSLRHPSCKYEIGIAACTVDEYIYFSGMSTGKYGNSGVIRYNTCTGRSDVRVNLNHSRTHHAMLRGRGEYKNKIFVIGGLPQLKGPCKILCDIESHDIDENIWEVVGKLKVLVHSCSPVFYCGRIYIFGGVNRPPARRTVCRDMQVYDLTTRQCSLFREVSPLSKPLVVTFKHWTILMTTSVCFLINMEKLSHLTHMSDPLDKNLYMNKMQGLKSVGFHAVVLDDRVYLFGDNTKYFDGKYQVLTNIKVANLTDFVPGNRNGISWKYTACLDQVHTQRYIPVGISFGCQ